MMYTQEILPVLAFLLDLAFGDPRNYPHPVRIIGWFALKTEAFLRGVQMVSLRVAGVIALVIVVGGSALAGYALLKLCGLFHPVVENAAAVLLLYFTIAARDLAVHADAVRKPLEIGRIDLAREKVGMIVGRDTASMQESDIALAAVESVAENTVDGVTAPLFYALLFGPIGALAYKAVNTLDSSFGYKNERYREFGWASARFDDLVNYLPSRLTVPCIAVASALLRMRYRDVFLSVRATAKKHASPNAGYPEAAFAGALGVRFGGPRSYGGEKHNLPYLGTAEGSCTTGTIRQAIRLMLLVSVLFLGAGAGFFMLLKVLSTIAVS